MMASDMNGFQDRLRRINHARHNGRGVPAPNDPRFIAHSDGIITRAPRRADRLRFGFPLKGLLSAFVIVVAVKAYMVTAIGYEVYSAEVSQLLSGSGLERVAGQILMPDAVTMWLADVYVVIGRQIGPIFGGA